MVALKMMPCKLANVCKRVNTYRLNYCFAWICLMVLSSPVYGQDGGNGMGTNNEFKVEIPGSYEECFYQFVPETATFYASLEVLRGQDQKVDVFVRSETMEVIHKELAIQETFYKMDNARQGTYSVCIDNVYSRFGSKLVFVYITAFEPAKFEAYVAEIEAIESLTRNATESMNKVQNSVRDMLMFQARRRYVDTNVGFHMVHDMYLARGNNYYVSVWSVFQCVVIVISSVVQVYLLRRLFRSTNVTPTTSKPRA